MQQFSGAFLRPKNTPADGWMPRWLSLWRLLCPTYLSDYIHLGSPKMWLGRFGVCFFWGFQRLELGMSGHTHTHKKKKHTKAFLGVVFGCFFVVLYKLNTFCHCMCSMVVQSGLQLPNYVISSDPMILFCNCLLIYPTYIYDGYHPLSSFSSLTNPILSKLCGVKQQQQQEEEEEQQQQQRPLVIFFNATLV